MLRLRLLIITAIVINSCAGEQQTNISTYDANTEYKDLLSDKTFIAFVESREHPLKWHDSIPRGRLLESLRPKRFELTAQPGEYFVFQLGIWAPNTGLDDVSLMFTDFTTTTGHTIPAQKITSFNQEGKDRRGIPFRKKTSIRSGRLQPLWIGMDLDSARKGNYDGSITISSGGNKQDVNLRLKVKGENVANRGFDEGKRLSRLCWLNSDAGIDNEVSKGYLPVKVDDNRISILGRSFTIGADGLPLSIVSYFDSSNQTIKSTGEAIVKNPFRIIIEKENGALVNLVPDELKFTEINDSRASWEVKCESEDLDLEVNGEMEYDGFVDYHLRLLPKKQVRVKDIRLEIPVVDKKARYMMGLGHEGGNRVPEWKWKWDISRNQDMLWLGDVTGGLRVKWKAENYIRPLINVYYDFRPLNLPVSWGNGGKGGVDISGRNEQVIIKAYSGSRVIYPGEILNYDFELLITPFRTIDRNNKFRERYYHGGGANTSAKVDSAKKAGANILNIHHNEDIYPFINYPYLDETHHDLRTLVSKAHEEGLRVKFYYTTRELTKNLPEFWAFYSLNGEIIFPGPGNSSRTVINPEGPNEWLIYNLREGYIPAWYNLITEGRFKGETDLSVITTPDSRLNNFYVAGLEWMVKNIEIDGVYIDDSALDRYTLQRARKVIDQNRPEGRMDLHSWNHFNEWAGYANCLNLYMDLLPYFDLVWIGEGRDYDRSPDHWLIEVSGIPFGLPGQMLEGGGNPWRGMVYGITNRAGWVGNTPVEIWKFWDKYDISDKMLSGYWEDNCPVRSSNNNVKASVFIGSEESIITVANWTDVDQSSSLSVNWESIGIDPSATEIFIPEVKNFQPAARSVSLTDLKIPAKKGFMIVVREKSAEK